MKDNNCTTLGDYVTTGIKLGLGVAAAVITLEYSKKLMEKVIDTALLYGMKKFVESGTTEEASEKGDISEEEKQDESGE